jgi:hypothetical protein
VRRLDERAWQMELWQGAAAQGPGAGFSVLARLVPADGGARLAGSWQALPGSCCPGRGRVEVEFLDGRSFRFISFAPSLDQASWPVLPAAVFAKKAELEPPDRLQRLAGRWRVSLWYGDLLPGGAPADPVQGQLSLAPRGAGLAGSWQGWPGELAAEPRAHGLELIYQDSAAGYQLSASLSPLGGGLALAGPFSSTLGQGRLQMVRAGLPAAPPGGGHQRESELAGTWVDPRTGSDYFQIKGSEAGFDFTAYGGSLAQPRYLTRGSARAAGPGRYQARAQDVEGYCCGNQGRLVFRLVEPDRMEVSSAWWPQGRPDPGAEPGEPYLIERVKKAPEAAKAPPAPAGRWPLVQPARPGLLPREAGAVHAAFAWQPGEARRSYTIFSQGGYRRDLDLWVDPEGRLAARIFTQNGPVELVADTKLEPGRRHEAWLIYQAGGLARLWLDGAEVAAAEQTAPWAGSRSPYLVGASRWPGRAFSGDIERVELFAAAQDPTQPAQADLVITPPPPRPASGDRAEAGAPRMAALVRLWHPGRLVHAYAAEPAELERLEAAGFVRQGPVGELADRGAEGLEPLYGFRHRGQGYTVLSTRQSPPPGCDSLGLLGHVRPEPGPETTPLYELKAEFAEPLRGGKSVDLLYTTRRGELEELRRAGYGQPRVVAHLWPAQEPPPAKPATFSWGGRWRGEGWGKFFLLRRGETLAMHWYYGRPDGPQYYGRYRLSADGRRAEGVAVGRPGKGASYYRHVLEFLTGGRQGPRVRLTSWRLAAPLDDGRLVSFQSPKPTTTLLIKEGGETPAQERARLEEFLAGPSPQELMHQALGAAKAQGRLLQR